MNKFSFLILFFLCSICCLSQDYTFNWANSIGDKNVDVPSGVAIDKSNNVYSVAVMSDTMDLDPGLGQFMHRLPEDNYSIIINKLDNNGNYKWSKIIEGKNFRTTFTIYSLKCHENHLYIAGQMNDGSADFDPGPDSTILSGGSKFFILKLDTSGQFVWIKTINHNGRFNVQRMVVETNNLYLAGYFSNRVDIALGPDTVYFQPSSSNSSNGHAFIIKYDTSGSLKWAKTIGNIGATYINAIQIDNKFQVYAAGKFDFKLDLNPSLTDSFIVRATDTALNVTTDVFILKLDSSGNFIMGKAFGSASNSLLGISSIVVDEYENIYNFGVFNFTSDFNPGIGTNNLSCNSSSDIFIQKLSKNGEFKWVKQIKGTFSEDVSDAFMSSKKNELIFVGNYSSLSTDFDPDSNSTYFLKGTNRLNTYVSKLDTNGKFLYAESMGSDGYKNAQFTAIDQEDNLFISGYFIDSSDFDLLSGTKILKSFNNNADMFTMSLKTCAQPSLPTNTTPTANTNICYNRLTNLSASGTGTINWYFDSTSTNLIYSGSNYTTPKQTGSTTFFAENYTCRGSKRIPISVNVKPPIVKTIVKNGNVLTTNNTTASTYQWLDCKTKTPLPNQTNKSINLTTFGSGSYAVILNENGCVDTSQCTNMTILSINQQADQAKLTLFPNPVTEFVKINSNIKINKIEIVDLTGRMVLTKNNFDQNDILRLEDVKAGIYFLKVIDNNLNFQTLKIQVVK